MQRIRFTGVPTGGWWTISDGTNTTAPLAYNASTGDIATALAEATPGAISASAVSGDYSSGILITTSATLTVDIAPGGSAAVTETTPGSSSGTPDNAISVSTTTAAALPTIYSSYSGAATGDEIQVYLSPDDGANVTFYVGDDDATVAAAFSGVGGATVDTDGSSYLTISSTALSNWSTSTFSFLTGAGSFTDSGSSAGRPQTDTIALDNGGDPASVNDGTFHIGSTYFLAWDDGGTAVKSAIESLLSVSGGSINVPSAGIWEYTYGDDLDHTTDGTPALAAGTAGDTLVVVPPDNTISVTTTTYALQPNEWNLYFTPGDGSGTFSLFIDSNEFSITSADTAASLLANISGFYPDATTSDYGGSTPYTIYFTDAEHALTVSGDVAGGDSDPAPYLVEYQPFAAGGPFQIDTIALDNGVDPGSIMRGTFTITGTSGIPYNDDGTYVQIGIETLLAIDGGSIDNPSPGVWDYTYGTGGDMTADTATLAANTEGDTLIAEVEVDEVQQLTIGAAVSGGTFSLTLPAPDSTVLTGLAWDIGDGTLQGLITGGSSFTGATVTGLAINYGVDSTLALATVDTSGLTVDPLIYSGGADAATVDSGSSFNPAWAFAANQFLLV